MPGSSTTPGRPVTRDDVPFVLPFARLTASAPGIKWLSWLNGWPMHSPADASLPLSQVTTHGSGPMWIAIPSS